MQFCSTASHVHQISDPVLGKDHKSPNKDTFNVTTKFHGWDVIKNIFPIYVLNDVSSYTLPNSHSLFISK